MSDLEETFMRTLALATEIAAKKWVEYVESGPGGPIQDEPDDDGDDDRELTRRFANMFRAAVEVFDNALKRPQNPE